MNALIRQIRSQTVLKNLKAVGNLRQPEHLGQFQSFYVLALKRYLYVLGTAGPDANKQNKAPIHILNRFEFEASVRFELFEDIEAFEHKDMIAVMHEQDKIVNFYDLLQFLELPVAAPLAKQDGAVDTDKQIEHQEMLPQLKTLYSFKNWKKVTSLLKVDFKNSFTGTGGKIQGMLVGDKVGDIQFINIRNLPKLQVENQGKDDNNDQQSAANSVAKLMYGHMQICTSIQRSTCGSYIISSDTMNKVVVNNFPNMFNLQAVNTDQTSQLLDLSLGQHLFATVSQDKTQSPQLRLIIADMQTGATVYEGGLGSQSEPGTGSTSIAFSQNESKLYWVDGNTQDGQHEQVHALNLDLSKGNKNVTVKVSNAKQGTSHKSSKDCNSLYLLKDNLTCFNFIFDGQYDKLAGHLSMPVYTVGDTDSNGNYETYLTKI